VVTGAYDALVLDNDRDLSNGYFGARPAQQVTMTSSSPLTAGQWTSVILTSTNTANGKAGVVMGAYIKLVDFPGNLAAVKLYLGDVWHNDGYPREWVNALYRTLGPFPGPGGSMTEQDERDFAYRYDHFYLSAALDVLRRPDWDLVILYQGSVDDFGHRYLLTDSRQISYTQPISQTYWNYVRASYQSVDAALAMISDTVGLTQTNIFAVSDHGMSPVHTTVQVNRLLAQNGIQVTPPITAYALGGGGYAHIYINTTARAGGVVSPGTLYRHARLDRVGVDQLYGWRHTSF
jgi:hypothetical protein